MSLDSLPNEILCYIIELSTRPNMFFCWLTLCKRAHRLCLDEKLFYMMKNRFISTVIIPLRTLGKRRLDILKIYPNKDIINIKRYIQNYHTGCQTVICSLSKQYTYQDNGSYTAIKYYTNTNKVERTIELKDNGYIGGSESWADFWSLNRLNGGVEGLYGGGEEVSSKVELYYPGPIKAKYDRLIDGEKSSAVLERFIYEMTESYIFENDKLITYNNRNGLIITFDHPSLHATLTSETFDHHVKIIDGVLIAVIFNKNLYKRVKYHHNDNGKDNINLNSNREREGQKEKVKKGRRRRRGKKAVLEWFNDWMKSYPLCINDEGKIIQKSIKIPVFKQYN